MLRDMTPWISAGSQRSRNSHIMWLRGVRTGGASGGRRSATNACEDDDDDNDDDDGALVGDEGAGGRETPESVDSVEVVLAPSEQRADEWDAKRDVCDERWKNDDDDEEAVAFGGAGICAERENERESRRRRPCC